MRHAPRWMLLSGVALVGAVACGSDDVGAGPGRASTGGSSGSSGGSGGVAGSDVLNPPPEPGTCRALCCSDDDCPAGQSCNAFDAATGTLGACSGTPEADGGAPLALDPLPAGCWAGAAPGCNPFTNTGCSAGAACDFGGDGDPTVPPEITCYDGDNTQGPGETCDAANGPWCVPGYHCVVD